LIVIGLDFDQPTLDNEGRSACYRLITRAQMLLMLVGPIIEGGFFEWMQFMDYDANNMREPEIDDAVPNKLTTSRRVHNQSINQHAASVVTPNNSLESQVLPLVSAVDSKIINYKHTIIGGNKDLAATTVEEAVTSIEVVAKDQIVNPPRPTFKKIATSIIDTTSNDVFHALSANCSFMPVKVR
jgi:hypothetical protein